MKKRKMRVIWVSVNDRTGQVWQAYDTKKDAILDTDWKLVKFIEADRKDKS